MPDLTPSYRAEPDGAFADRLERLLVQRLTAPTTSSAGDAALTTRASGADIAPTARWDDQDDALIDLNARDATRRPDRRRLAARLALASAAAALIAVALTVAIRNDDEPDPADVPTTTLDVPHPTPFEGGWVSIDADGSTQTMAIRRSGSDFEVVVADDFASVCSGVPSTMTGTGHVDADGALVLPQPVLTCDDGSEPVALSGPPLQEQIENLAFVHDPQADVLSDNLGTTWVRPGAGTEPPASSRMWPQSTLDEVRAAQDLADAGDPAYNWQLDPALDGDAAPWGAEIFTRFIEEELGWEEFVGGWDGSGYLSMGAGGGVYEGVTFIRCAPGQTNPLSPLYGDAPPEIRRCAPTIDGLRWETVSVDVSQPGLRGASGIWVVERWELRRQSTSCEVGDSLFGILHPECDGQVEQVVPPSEAVVNAYLEEFLQARVDGDGAERYVLHEPGRSPLPHEEVPLLYATTGGARYERFEIEKFQGPVWPTGWTVFRLRLFAEDGTVVEQLFHVVRHDGQFGLIYGYAYDHLPTTENGQSVPVPYRILDGAVTFAAAPPWYSSVPSDTLVRLTVSRNGHVVIATDPLPAVTGCENGSAPADAAALARRIMADPNSETIGPVPVRIAGVDGLQLDMEVDTNAVVSTEETYSCTWMWAPDQGDQWRMRLYLLDHLGESAHVLAIAVIAAPATDFERVLAEAVPIVESLEFHTG